MALTSIFITAYKTRASSLVFGTSECPSFSMKCTDATKTKTNIQLSMPDQKVYYVACFLTNCMHIIYSAINITFVKKN